MWLHLDKVFSYISDSLGCDDITYWIEREAGKKDYSLVAKTPEGRISGIDLINKFPETKKWLHENEIYLEEEGFVNNFVNNQIVNGLWNARRDPDEKVISSIKRKTFSHLWEDIPYLSQNYYQSILNDSITGHSQDKWIKELNNYLKNPMTEENLPIVDKMVSKAVKSNWESKSGISLRYIANLQPSWDSLLNKWDVSFRMKHLGLPFVLHCLKDNNFHGLNDWFREVGVGASFAPRSDEVPSSWWPEEVMPSASLWHWSCKVSSLEMIKLILDSDKSLLNTVDSFGRTALHWACAFGREEVCDFLSSIKGIDLNIEDNDGLIAAQMVPEDKDHVFEMLENKRFSKKY